MDFCYQNGQIIEVTKASVPITNLGLHRGLSIFDLFRARNGEPTFLSDYLDRFENSQKFLQLSSLISSEEIIQAVADLQKKNGFRNSTFKMVLLGDGLETDSVLNPFFTILNTQLPDDLSSTASSLITHEYHREHPEIKSLNYLASFKLQQQRVQAGAVDILFHQNDRISETSRSNVFIVKNGIISTPDQGILLGITRKNLLKAMDGKFEIQQRVVSTDELLDADEVFITSTIKEVMPIVKINDQTIGSGHAGKITLAASKGFQDLILG